jgi:hypothetical protein
MTEAVLSLVSMSDALSAAVHDARRNEKAERTAMAFNFFRDFKVPFVICC